MDKISRRFESTGSHEDLSKKSFKKSHNNDVDRQYVSRKEGGRGLASIEDCIDTSIQGLEKLKEPRKTNPSSQ